MAGFLLAVVPALFFVKEPRVEVPPLPEAPAVAASLSVRAPIASAPVASGAGLLGDELLGEWDDDDGEEEPSPGMQQQKVPVWEITALMSGVDKGRALRTLRRNYEAIEQCYQQHRATPKVAGKLGLSFKVQGNGHVSEVRIAEGSTRSREFRACVQDLFEKMRFRLEEGQEGGSISLRYSFE